MKSLFNTFLYEELEGPDKGLPDGGLYIKSMTIIEGIASIRHSTSYFLDAISSLFEGCGGFSTYSYMPRVELEHDSTWDDFGRAYYSSCNYQFTEFHFTLYSVDEIQRQIEERMRQYGQNDSISAPCFTCNAHESRLLDLYFAESPWNEELSAWMDGFKARTVFERNLWEADEHSCRPFKDKYIYQHQLAKQSLSGYKPQTSAASRPCCRSFLMASRHQLSGDDLLGH